MEGLLPSDDSFRTDDAPFERGARLPDVRVLLLLPTKVCFVGELPLLLLLLLLLLLILLSSSLLLFLRGVGVASRRDVDPDLPPALLSFDEAALRGGGEGCCCCCCFKLSVRTRALFWLLSTNVDAAALLERLLGDAFLSPLAAVEALKGVVVVAVELSVVVVVEAVVVDHNHHLHICS